MNIKQILESLLFVNEKPIAIKELAEVLAEDKKEIITALEELSAEYAERECGISIVKVAGGFQMCSHPDNSEWVKKMFREKNKQKLSGASLEAVAIIAYKQPITRTEIEAIRGVNSDGVVRHLLAWGLVKEAGRKEVPGRPFLYITTRKFLEYFGLNSLKDLPCLEEFTEFSKDLERENEEISGQTEKADLLPEESKSETMSGPQLESEDFQPADIRLKSGDVLQGPDLICELDHSGSAQAKETDPDFNEDTKPINTEG